MILQSVAENGQLPVGLEASEGLLGRRAPRGDAADGRQRAPGLRGEIHARGELSAVDGHLR